MRFKAWLFPHMLHLRCMMGWSGGEEQDEDEEENGMMMTHLMVNVITLRGIAWTNLQENIIGHRTLCLWQMEKKQ